MGPVFLIGYRATGKSSVGRILAAELDVPFADTDSLVEEAIGATIAAYFAQHGEAAFRDRESEALAGALARRNETGGAVVATGGGIILRPDNVRRMRASGRVVWLTAEPASIRARLSLDPRSAASRPALAGRSTMDEVEQVLSAREPLYRSAAHVEVSTEGRGPREVALEILEWLQGPEGGVEEMKR